MSAKKMKTLTMNGITYEIVDEYARTNLKQADWNQTDETQNDYIKNRSHWIESNIILPDTEFNVVDGYGLISGNFLSLWDDRNYFVTINGIEYETTIAWGGTGIGALVNDDVPFKLWTMSLSNEMSFEYSVDGTYTVSVREETFHKLDPKYIPYPSEIGAATAEHRQAASTITKGTFAGQVIAQSSTQAPDTSLLRNSKLVSSETTPTVNGEICWMYE